MGKRVIGRSLRSLRTGGSRAHLGLLAGSVCLLAVLLTWSSLSPMTMGGDVGRAHAAGAAARNDATGTTTANATDTPTPPPTSTPTTAPTATSTPSPTLTMLSPSSGAGPVGAHITLGGTHWGTGHLTLGAVPNGAACGAPSNWYLLPSATPTGSDGSFTQTFIWPVSLSDTNGSYNICVKNAGGQSASVPYSVLSSAPPIIALSVGSVPVGSSVTITGSNFFSSLPIDIDLQTNTQGSTGQTRLVGTASPEGNGTFTYSYSAISGDVGSLTVLAQTQPEGQAPSALYATATLNVLDAPTPTASASATAAATTTTQPVVVPTVPQSGANTPSALMVGLIAMIALVLAVVIGIVAFLLLRRKGDEPSQGGWPASPGGSGSGWSTSQRYPAQPFPDEDPWPAALGGVARWDDSTNDLEDGPGPDWRGRTMGGTRPRMPTVDSPGRVDDRTAPTLRTPRLPADPYGQSGARDPYGPPPADAPTLRLSTPEGAPWRQSGAPPADPWGPSEPQQPYAPADSWGRETGQYHSGRQPGYSEEPYPRWDEPGDVPPTRGPAEPSDPRGWPPDGNSRW